MQGYEKTLEVNDSLLGVSPTAARNSSLKRTISDTIDRKRSP